MSRLAEMKRVRETKNELRKKANKAKSNAKQQEKKVEEKKVSTKATPMQWMPAGVWGDISRALSYEGIELGAVEIKTLSTKVGQVGVDYNMYPQDIKYRIELEYHRLTLGQNGKYKSTDYEELVLNTPMERVGEVWLEMFHSTIRKLMTKRIASSIRNYGIRLDCKDDFESMVDWGMDLVGLTIYNIKLPYVPMQLVPDNLKGLPSIDTYNDVFHMLSTLGSITCRRHAKMYELEGRLADRMKICGEIGMVDNCYGEMIDWSGDYEEWFIAPITQYLMSFYGERDAYLEELAELKGSQDAARKDYYEAMWECVPDVSEIMSTLTYREVEEINKRLKGENNFAWEPVEELPEYVEVELKYRVAVTKIGKSWSTTQKYLKDLYELYDWETPDWYLELVDKLDDHGMTKTYMRNELMKLSITSLRSIVLVYEDIERSLEEEWEYVVATQPTPVKRLQERRIKDKVAKRRKRINANKKEII